MVGGFEVTANDIMTLFAFRGTNIFCSRHIGQSHGPIRDGTAGNHRQQEAARNGGQSQAALPPAPEPEAIEK
jgi:hypothetical protein